MEEVIIYKCEVCGKESRIRENTRLHEIECKEKVKLKKIREANKEKWNKEFIRNFNPDNFKEQINEYLAKSCGDHFDDLEIDVSFSEKVSCSHEAPFGEDTNWSGDDSKPLHFPGLVGSVIGTYSKDDQTFSEYCDWSNNNIQIPGLHTGTGGGSRNRFKYIFYIFVQDFGNLSRFYAKELLINE